jgi:hypothetical protein
MFSPTVTELPRRLEPISPDTFNDAGRVPPNGRPSPSDSPAGFDNVVVLRPAAAGARLAAA